jgi:hypothetical protein
VLDSIFYTSYVALWALVIFQTLVLLGLVRQVSTNREALDHEVNPPEDALPSGSLAPEFQTLEARAKQLVQSRNWVGRPTILVFMSPHCSVCDLVAEEVENFGRRVKAQLAVLCHGEMSECVQFAATHFLRQRFYSMRAVLLRSNFELTGHRWQYCWTVIGNYYATDSRVLRREWVSTSC